MKITANQVVWALLLVAGFPEAKAATITLPAELQPGDTYRILFMTSTTTAAFSPDISHYNAVVTAAALSDPNLAALSANWFALASTAAVNALANTGLSLADTQTSFFNTLGEKVAVGVSGGPNSLYSGISFLSQIYHQDGTLPGFSGAEHIWTGTDADGNTDCPLGGGCIYGPLHFESRVGNVYPAIMIGDLDAHPLWIAAGNNLDWSENYLYGVSGLLTVPGASTPEPGTLALAALASVVVGLNRLDRNRLRRK